MEKAKIEIQDWILPFILGLTCAVFCIIILIDPLGIGGMYQIVGLIVTGLFAFLFFMLAISNVTTIKGWSEKL